MRCKCGTVRGVLHDVSSGTRAVCYCDDCQAFANYLSTGSGILDEHGGTDIFQISPAQIEITQGIDHLACVRVTPKGGLRWYTDCCRTPIGNTMPTTVLPFIGLIHSCIDAGGRSLDDILGPVRWRVMGQYALGDISHLDVHERFPLSSFPAAIWKIIKWRLRGDHKRSPFFNHDTGLPIAEPQYIGDFK